MNFSHSVRVSAAAYLLILCSLSQAGAQDSTLWAAEFFAKSDAAATLAAKAAPDRAVRRRAVTVRPASSEPEVRESTSLAGSAITWHASSSCVPQQLRAVLADVVSNFGPITVSSTCRSVAGNRAAGGAGQSYHLSGQAVDFRAGANAGAIYAALSANRAVGGLKHYGGGLFHIDTGPRRPF